MKSSVRLSALVACAAVLSACASFESLTQGSRIEYKSAGKLPPLDIPPDLVGPRADERFSIPDRVQPGQRTLSGFQGARPAERPSADSARVLPSVEGMRVERSGNQRWLVVTAPADKLWGPVKDFWQENGFIIAIERPDAGVMETDWAEDRAKIDDDIIRGTLGKFLDSLYSTGERDKFRTRFEPGAEPGTTDIFVSHRGMEEVYTSTSKDETRWQPRPANPELEAEMLRRLMVSLGAENKRAEASVAAAKAEPRARLASSNEGSGTLEVYERFDRAWRRVGLALDRVGFTVEDRDRSKGLYYVRYVDPDANLKKGTGWLDKLSFWKSSEPAGSGKPQYRIHVSESGQNSVVQVLSSEGGTDKSETAKRILSLLYQQLQ